MYVKEYINTTALSLHSARWDKLIMQDEPILYEYCRINVDKCFFVPPQWIKLLQVNIFFVSNIKFNISACDRFLTDRFFFLLGGGWGGGGGSHSLLYFKPSFEVTL